MEELAPTPAEYHTSGRAGLLTETAWSTHRSLAVPLSRTAFPTCNHLGLAIVGPGAAARARAADPEDISKRQATTGAQGCIYSPGGNVGSGSSTPGNSGGSGGTPITWEQGPDSPTCTASCGTLCTGYYCTPNPTGEPPGFWDPLDPTHGSGNGTTTPFSTPTGLPPLTPTPTTITCAPPAVQTTTVECNGSGGHSVCITSQFCTDLGPLPTLTPTTCPRPWSTTTVCAGSGEQSACEPSSVCPPPTPIPTASGTPLSCATAGQLCLGTTLFTQCDAIGGNQRRAPRELTLPTATASVGDREDDHFPATPIDREAALSLITIAPKPPRSYPPSINNNKEERNYELQIGPRQDDGCSVFSACKLCVTVTAYPCLNIQIIGTGDFFNNDWEARVIEDGVTTCSTLFSCANCQGIDTMTDCGSGGSSWRFTDNEIWYYSQKYKANFNYILPIAGSSEFGCGMRSSLFPSSLSLRLT